MKEDFNLYSWKYQQLTEEIRKEIESNIDGIIPEIKGIDFSYNNFGQLYKIKFSTNIIYYKVNELKSQELFFTYL